MQNEAKVSPLHCKLTAKLRRTNYAAPCHSGRGFKTLSRRLVHQNASVKPVRSILKIIHNHANRVLVITGRASRLHECRKYPIELLDNNTKPVHSPPYEEKLKTKKFEKVEIDKMIILYVMELAQTKWAAQIVFTPKINGNLIF